MDKKNGRPTWAMVREMEDVIHRQCAELDAWREKYRALVGVSRLHDGVVEESATMSGEIIGLRSKNATLEQSNALMEKELRRLRAELDEQRASGESHYAALKALEGRGFWSRLFNRKTGI